MHNTDNMSTKGRRTGRRWIVAGTAALMAAGGLAALEASTAQAEEVINDQENFTTTIKPFETIFLPNMGCRSGYLEDVDYSPGRLVPRGVQVLEPGGIGVTITKATLGQAPAGQNWRPLTGPDNINGAANATNWDLFSSHELTIKLHCTSDLSKAAKKTSIPGFE